MINKFIFFIFYFLFFKLFASWEISTEIDYFQSNPINKKENFEINSFITNSSLKQSDVSILRKDQIFKEELFGRKNVENFTFGDFPKGIDIVFKIKKKHHPSLKTYLEISSMFSSYEKNSFSEYFISPKNQDDMFSGFLTLSKKDIFFLGNIFLGGGIEYLQENFSFMKIKPFISLSAGLGLPVIAQNKSRILIDEHENKNNILINKNNLSNIETILPRSYEISTETTYIPEISYYSDIKVGLHFFATQRVKTSLFFGLKGSTLSFRKSQVKQSTDALSIATEEDNNEVKGDVLKKEKEVKTLQGNGFSALLLISKIGLSINFFFKKNQFK